MIPPVSTSVVLLVAVTFRSSLQMRGQYSMLYSELYGFLPRTFEKKVANRSK